MNQLLTHRERTPSTRWIGSQVNCTYMNCTWVTMFLNRNFYIIAKISQYHKAAILTDCTNRIVSNAILCDILVLLLSLFINV